MFRLPYLRPKRRIGGQSNAVALDQLHKSILRQVGMELHLQYLWWDTGVSQYVKNEAPVEIT